MSKYYVPELSEFHHDCVFYIRYRDMESYVIKSIIADTWAIGIESPREAINMHGEDGVFMKHLDKSDIEELGWKLQKTEGKRITTGGVSQEYKITTTNGRRKRSYKLLTKGATSAGYRIYLLHPKSSKFNKLIFEGDIKNYNELKKLQNMLGI